jgi:Pectate lyase superfamily protein
VVTGLPGKPPPTVEAAAPRLTRRRALLVGATGIAGLTAVALSRRGAPDASAPPTGGGSATGAPSPAEAEAEVPLRPADFGAVGDGVADDTAAVQALLDASSASGREARLPAGTYRCTASLLVSTGLDLHLEEGARLSKDWATAPGVARAFLRNADFAVRADGVRVTGPGSIGARDHSRTGVVMAVFGDDVRLSDITVSTYAGGQAIVYAGDRGRVDRVRVLDSAVTTGTGGIRVVGGADFRATACHVESGDDALQFVPVGDPGALLYDMDVSGGSYVGCTGRSTVSRFMVASLEWTKGDTGMRASVRDCSFTDCHGVAIDRGIVVKNTHSSGTIERLRFTDCTVDMPDGVDPQTQGIRVQTAPAAGGAIRDVSFTRTDITSPRISTLRVGGPRISGLTFEQCTFTAPSGDATVTAVVDAADAVTLRLCAVRGGAGKRLLVVGTGAPATGFVVEDCDVSGIGDGTWAVDLVAVTGGRVAGTTFRPAPGATDAGAVRVAPASSGVVIEGNDLRALGSRRPINDRAADTVLRDNLIG